MLIKVKPDATVCRYVFTAKSFYMFRVSQHPSSEVLKSVTAASGTGHNIGRATSLQRGRSGHDGAKWLYRYYGNHWCRNIIACSKIVGPEDGMSFG